MNIRCHGCHRQFRVRRDRLPAGGARTRCPRCDEVLVIPPQEATPDTPQAQAPEAKPGPSDGELFELPPADLQPLDEDPVFTAQEPAPRPSSDEAPPPPEPAVDSGEHDDEPGADVTAPRRGGLRGWLGRLFGRDA